jgi:hypothetical protein
VTLEYNPYDEDQGPRLESIYFPIQIAHGEYFEGDRFWAYKNPESLRW